MVVEGTMEGSAEGRTSANVYGVIPGQSGKFVVLVVGDHEDPGVGATDHFIDTNRELIEHDPVWLMSMPMPRLPGSQHS